MANALEKTRWPFALAKTRWLFQRVRGALTKRVLGSLGSERYCIYYSFFFLCVFCGAFKIDYNLK